MRRSKWFTPLLLAAACAGGPAFAQPPATRLVMAQGQVAADVFFAMRSGDWAAADAAAVAQSPDPVARKLVLFYRLITPHTASASEIAAFMAASPDWPLPGLLARRRDEALASEPDDATVAGLCDQAAPPIAIAAARLRCADAFAHAGRSGDAAQAVRQAWIDGPSDPTWETGFLQRWSSTLTRDVQWRRFDRLAWTDPAGAKRQAARLDGADRARADTRLALKRDDPSALGLLAVLPADARSDPALVLEQARWLRRAGHDDDAVALWQSAGAQAEQAASADHLAAFWDERNVLARHLLRAGDAKNAYAVAAAHAQRAPEQLGDAEFLAGFIALRRLNDIPAAIRHFGAVAAASKAAITQARAHYWLGRAIAERGDADAASAEYRNAAAFPNTFYGQLAIVALGDGDHLAQRIRDARDPAADRTQALGLAGRELARAAALVVAWGEPRRATIFLLRLSEVAPDPADRALTARLAAGFGLAETAIAIARRAGRDGVVLLETGWPIAALVPQNAGLDPALALAVIRQESSFDTATTSPAGARGLMQLMPATATITARQLGLPVSIAALNADPGYNMQLGTTYLRGLMEQYGGGIALAAAAYNAGPSRVTDWLAGNGDPVRGGADLIDWIELIPFNETRNYVQRVIENAVVYRAERGDKAAHPLTQWLR